MENSQSDSSASAKDIQLKDDYNLLQIMGHPPGWLLRWGMVVLLIVFIGLGILSWLVKYPDVIPARITLTTTHPPVRVVARANGKISELLIKNGASVTAGADIIILDNNAKKESVDQLSIFLNKIDQEKIPLSKIALPKALQLGDLESTYANFVRQLQNYRYDLRAKTVGRKASVLKKQIDQIKSLNESLGTQEATLNEMLAMARQRENRQRILLAEGSVSIQDVEEAQREVLTAKGNLENLQNQLIGNTVKIEELNLAILDIKERKKNTDYDQSLGVHESIANMREAIREWQRRFVIQSPIEGIVATTRPLTTQQFVKENEVLLTIIPNETDDEFLGRALLPLRGAGKINPGMSVNIRLDGYPYQEFGAVRAAVEEVSLVPESDGQYLVKVFIPKTMETTYGRVIPFRQEMQGTANIITQERRIIARIFDKIWSLAFN